MIDENMFVQLQRLGCAPKEALVYVALLGLGTSGSAHIIEKTKLHGQFVYQALAKLEARGLASHIVVRGRKKFQAAHPQTLVRLAERQVRLAEDVARSLERTLTVPADSTFEVYQGVEAFREHEQELLRRAGDKSEVLVIGGFGDRWQESMDEALGAYEFRRRQKQVRVRYLGSRDQVTALKKDEANRFFFEARVLPSTFTGMVNTNIWAEVISLNTFGTPVTNFTLRSKPVAESYRSFFEALWMLAK